MKLISVKHRLPEYNQYVLAHLVLNNWHDEDDPNGNRYWVVVKFKKAAVEGNNLQPFQWREFGHSTFFGQQVDYWCELPKIV
jgi:hypothetical protein